MKVEDYSLVKYEFLFYNYRYLDTILARHTNNFNNKKYQKINNSLRARHVMKHFLFIYKQIQDTILDRQNCNTNSKKQDM